jgi:hypothetical protein
MSLWAACGLTVALETAFLAVCGLRTLPFLAVCVCANAATNLTLNLLLGPLSAMVDITWFIYALEAAVVAAEYGAYAALLGPSKRLFLLTLAANTLSYCVGLLLCGHV